MKKPKKAKLDEIWHLFDLTNLVKEKTCCTKIHESTIDIFLKNVSFSLFSEIALQKLV